MMKVRLALAACLALAAGSLAVSCGNSAADDEGATVVNVEKGVAPAVSTPEAAGAMVPDNMDQPVGIIGAPVAEQPEVEQPALPAADVEEEAPKPVDKPARKKAETE